MKLHSVGVAPVQVRLPHGRETEDRLPAEELPLIAEVNKEIGFQRLPFADDSGSFIKAATGEPYPEARELLKEARRKTLVERETQWIAGYDAHFLASMRIQFTSQASPTESLRSFQRGPTRDSGR